MRTQFYDGSLVKRKNHIVGERAILLAEDDRKH